MIRGLPAEHMLSQSPELATIFGFFKRLLLLPSYSWNIRKLSISYTHDITVANTTPQFFRATMTSAVRNNRLRLQKPPR